MRTNEVEVGFKVLIKENFFFHPAIHESVPKVCGESH